MKEMIDNGSSQRRNDKRNSHSPDPDKVSYNNQQRETRRHVSMEEIDPLGRVLCSDTDVEELVCGGEYADLYEAIRQLEPKARQLVTAYYFQGKSQTEIAAEEGIKKAAVSRRLSRSLTVLQQLLKKISAPCKLCPFPVDHL